MTWSLDVVGSDAALSLDVPEERIVPGPTWGKDFLKSV